MSLIADMNETAQPQYDSAFMERLCQIAQLALGG
jgi:hypothetical protein